jgi:hypothetical protein
VDPGQAVNDLLTGGTPLPDGGQRLTIF